MPATCMNLHETRNAKIIFKLHSSDLIVYLNSKCDSILMVLDDVKF